MTCFVCSKPCAPTYKVAGRHAHPGCASGKVPPPYGGSISPVFATAWLWMVNNVVRGDLERECQRVLQGDLP